MAEAYYWVPQPHVQVWGLLACHDLGVWGGVSHREFWPYVLEHLATAWGEGPKLPKRRLLDHHAGLPRGRVIRPKSGYVVIHGDDAPVSNWVGPVKARFRLIGVEVAPESTEHEKMLADEPKAVKEALGTSLDPKTTA